MTKEREECTSGQGCDLKIQSLESRVKALRDAFIFMKHFVRDLGLKETQKYELITHFEGALTADDLAAGKEQTRED